MHLDLLYRIRLLPDFAILLQSSQSPQNNRDYYFYLLKIKRVITWRVSHSSADCRVTTCSHKWDAFVFSSTFQILVTVIIMFMRDPNSF